MLCFIHRRTEDTAMSIQKLHKPHHPPLPHSEPDDPEPGMLPIEPDQGLVPTHIPDDPEHDRVIDPEA